MRHAAAKDDVYMGYTIPAGAGLANNISPFLSPLPSPPPLPFPPQQNTRTWTLNNSPSYAFQPQQQRARFTLGAGRRVRPGTRVADRALSAAPAKAALGVLSPARAAGTPDRAGCCGGRAGGLVVSSVWCR